MAAAKKQASKRVLASNVYVDGVLYPAGEDVPAEVADKVTNPKAWGESPASDDE